ncbi:MAG: ABC transporter ATP-binding protein [Candidatus Fluviicola riflensis]|nr:MAG: ABC transporter ATP-binding protein [Candidatus Fluviicola riflensis]OGS79080.1 MAG: ABC transporter ATP-binding protein [Candidatus Fluviicola riflensis]OGS86103.1 MAG: ABC transporter ATP-binding protein [Fluviicola sp. RIFCSPHIGHO2_12_FULL_43_24]OGS86512.1 MAG: ABC transporter ATP-binding protein [Fluviicola sp. RIFCSPHIGHO2_01_FULL_43_53]
MKLLLSYLKRYKSLVFLALILATINQVFSLLDPTIFGKIIDYLNGYVSGKKTVSQEEFLWAIAKLLGASIGVAMVSRIAKAFQDYFTNLVIQRIGADIYTDGLKHTLQVPFQEFEDQRSGETLNVLQKVRTDSEKFILSFINIVFASLVGLVFVMIYTATVFGGLIPVYIIAAVALGLITSYLSRRIKKVQTTIVRETKLLAGSTTESLRNIELIKSLGLTNQETTRLNDTTRKILQLELKKVRDIRSISFIQGTLVNLTRQIILFILCYLVFGSVLTPGQIITLQFFSFFIFGPLQEVGSVLISYREMQASMENFEQIVNTPLEVKPVNPAPMGFIERLRFDNVSFRHKTAQYDALTNIYFEVEKGETIAFVGPSGSGKSTLVKLLVGLYSPLNGDIHYNNISVTNLDKDELQQQLGFVTQDTQLFAGTIRENLLFVKPDATDDELDQALSKAACDNLIERSEKGIDTIIGEGGMKLSGGEKQRLSIARALLRNPRLLVFDEATSALDSLTEEAISNTIKSITNQKEHITVLIAHRLSTIMHADRIFVLEKGVIIETGKHEELLTEKGLYYAMWRQQIGERRE